MTSRTICRLTWGSPDFAAELKNDAWDLLTAISPVGNMSNLLTPLLLVPEWCSPWKKWERKRHAKQQEWFRRNMEEVKHRIQAGTAGTSLLSLPILDLKIDCFNTDNE